MAYIKIRDVWQNEFNSKNKQYQIKHFLLEDGHSCVYELEDGRELRISVRIHMCQFVKSLLGKSYKHVARLYDCFMMVLKDEYNEDLKVVCVISESINRNFAPKETIQSGINLFRNIWIDNLKYKHFSLYTDDDIENVYAENNVDVEKKVIRGIKGTETDATIKEIALALHGAYKTIKTKNINSSLFLFADNIGMSHDGIIKLCNIVQNYNGLNEYYGIETTRSSVTVTFNPAIGDDNMVDNRMLMPLKVDIGNGNALPALGQIDTGASVSGFTETFYKRAQLEKLGDVKTAGVTGVMDSISTKCEVVFPNGYKTTLHGSTMRPIDGVDILIGMDLLSICKFQSEPYRNGLRYKITFK